MAEKDEPHKKTGSRYRVVKLKATPDEETQQQQEEMTPRTGPRVTAKRGKKLRVGPRRQVAFVPEVPGAGESAVGESTSDEQTEPPHTESQQDVVDKEREFLDYKAQLGKMWTSREAALYCGLAPNTWYIYRNRPNAPTPLDPDARQLMYDPEMVKEWNRDRQRAGWRFKPKGLQ